MDDLGTLIGLASASLQQGHHEQALRLYSQALALAPGHPGLLNNRAAILEKLGRLDEALASYESAHVHMPNHTGILNNVGLVLMKLQRLDEALASIDRAIAINPLNAEAFNNRGNVLTRQRRWEEALASYERAIALRPGHPTALFNRALVFQDLKRYGEAAAAFADILRRDLAFPGAPQLLLNNRLRCCDWTDHQALVADIVRRVENGEAPADPFHLLVIADRPSTQLAGAAAFAARFGTATPHARPAQRENDRIHVAYLCADFGNRHATWYLTEGLFGRHDRSRFKTIGVPIGPVQDATAPSHFDEWIDGSQCSDADIARLLRQRQVDIAVDLNGFSGASRPAIFAHRAAPIQLSWLAFPGTMGMSCIDYIVADRHVVPAGHERFYAENIIRLPDTYQANNHRRHPVERPTSRAENGLPEAGFVFCCFNNNHKITPGLFDIWMRLLREVAGSVLWLLADNDDAITNLRREAETRGVAGSRLVFAARVDGGAHLARHGCADLFLDTLPYNAHTTATDALWTGLPVLTCQGETFAARVASSVLQAAGVPELITASLADYEAMARRLATEPNELVRLKAKLRNGRATCPLFDLDRFAENLETAYATVLERHRSGLPPASFDL